jgi:hypothetical protein
VQYRRTAARQTDDEKRFANLLSRDAWIRLPISLYEQTRTQYAYEIGPQDDSPDQVKLSLALAGIE